MESNFEKIESYEADVRDTDYDFDSIMQYGNTAFTMNGGDTMRDKFDDNKPLGGKNLTATDVLELNKAYQCHGKFRLTAIVTQGSFRARHSLRISENQIWPEQKP